MKEFKCPKCGSVDIKFYSGKKFMYPYSKCNDCGEIFPYPKEYAEQQRLERVFKYFDIEEDGNYFMRSKNYSMIIYTHKTFYLTFFDEHFEISLNTVESLLIDLGVIQDE